jgi:hypothetical protein
LTLPFCADTLDLTLPTKAFSGRIMHIQNGLISFIPSSNELMLALAFTSEIRVQAVPVGAANFQTRYQVRGATLPPFPWC